MAHLSSKEKMYSSTVVVGKNYIVFFLQKNYNFSNGDYCVQNLPISVTNGFQTNIERLKMFSSNTFDVSDLFK